MHDQQQDGNDVKEIAPHGFQGISCGHVTVGERDGLLLAQVKSGLADEVAKELKTNGIETKVTRADWQVTVQREGQATGYAETIRHRARRSPEMLGGNVPQTTVVYEGPDAGDSCYIRSGRGDSCFRAYHKTIEAPGSYPLNTWRYELQLRGKRARGSWKMFQSAANSTWLARSLCSGFMLQYGLEESWQLSNEPCKSPSRYDASDTQRRLAWWNSTVVRVAERLMDAGITLPELTDAFRKHAATAPRRSRQEALKVYSGWQPAAVTQEEKGNDKEVNSLFQPRG